MHQPELYCEVCGRDHTTTPDLVIARWHDMAVCTDCLAAHAELEADGFFDETDAAPERSAP